MKTLCLCPLEGHKQVLLLKRTVIALDIRFIEINASSSAGTVKLAKPKAITLLLTSRAAVILSCNVKALKFKPALLP